jgi:hypothetical protein
MRRLVLFVEFIFLVNLIQGQTDISTKIIGKWYSVERYKKNPRRVLIFEKDSNYSETISGSLGTITLISKYYFTQDTLIVIAGTKSKIQFTGNDKIIFVVSKKDTADDTMYKFKFKRQ